MNSFIFTWQHLFLQRLRVRPVQGHYHRTQNPKPCRAAPKLRQSEPPIYHEMKLWCATEKTKPSRKFISHLVSSKHRNQIFAMLQSFARTAVRYNSTVAHTAPRALSNAYVNKLETRWEKLPKQDQTALIEQLKARMELPWSELTSAEKKAAFYISFGEWGPRRPLYAPGEKNKVFWGTVMGCVAGCALFAGLRSMAPEDPVSMNKEWQMKSDEWLKSKNANPFTGYSQIQ